MNKYGELLEMIVESRCGNASEDFMMEGVNWDIHKLSKQFKEDKRSKIADIKKYMTEGEYDKARKEIKKQRDIIKRYKKLIEGVESGLGATVIGFICHSVFTYLKTLIAGVLTIPVGGIGAIAVQLNDIAKTSFQTTKMAENKEEFSWDVFNTYKGKVLYLIGKTSKLLDTMEKTCDKLEKGDDDTNKTDSTATTESVTTPTDLQIAVYESALNGEISADERDLILGLIGET